MGRSDDTLIPWYKERIVPKGKIALLGFTNERIFRGDCYDMEIGNWQINSDWRLPVIYDSIVCLRCAYFAADPQGFIERCCASLGEGDSLYVDWSYGEHWRLPGFRVGWVGKGIHEYAYGEDNKLWSGVWDDSFMQNPHVQSFARHIRQHGYDNLRDAVYREVPKVLELRFVKRYFEIDWHALCIVKPYLQLYILLCGRKK